MCVYSLNFLVKRVFLIINSCCFESTSCSFILWLLDEGGQSWLVGQTAQILVAALLEVLDASTDLFDELILLCGVDRLKASQLRQDKPGTDVLAVAADS